MLQITIYIENILVENDYETIRKHFVQYILGYIVVSTLYRKPQKFCECKFFILCSMHISLLCRKLQHTYLLSMYNN